MPQHYLHTNRSTRTCCVLLNLYFSLSLSLYWRLRFDCSAKQSLNLRRIYSSFSVTAIHEIYILYILACLQFIPIDRSSLGHCTKCLKCSIIHMQMQEAPKRRLYFILYLIYSNCCWYIFIVYEIHLIHKTCAGYYNLKGISQRLHCLKRVKFALEIRYYWN